MEGLLEDWTAATVGVLQGRARYGVKREGAGRRMWEGEMVSLCGSRSLPSEAVRMASGIAS